MNNIFIPVIAAHMLPNLNNKYILENKVDYKKLMNVTSKKCVSTKSTSPSISDGKKNSSKNINVDDDEPLL